MWNLNLKKRYESRKETGKRKGTNRKAGTIKGNGAVNMIKEYYTHV
jgi:hypothetical protein